MNTKSVNHSDDAVFEAIPLMAAIEQETPEGVEPASATTIAIRRRQKAQVDGNVLLWAVIIASLVYLVCFVFGMAYFERRSRQKQLRNSVRVVRTQHSGITTSHGVTGTKFGSVERGRDDNEVVLLEDQIQEFAEELTEETFDRFLIHHPKAFVNFATWRSHSRTLASTWQKFAQEIRDANGMDVGIGHVNCLTQVNLCRKQHVLAFPTLRWFERPVDYRGHRSVDELMDFAISKVGTTDGRLQIGTSMSAPQSVYYANAINNGLDEAQNAVVADRAGLARTKVSGGESLRLAHPSHHHHKLNTDTRERNDYVFDLRRIEAEPQVVELTEDSFDDFLKSNEMAFVNFCTPGSVWCQRLAPSWEQFAQIAHNIHMPVGVGRVDCNAYQDFCLQTQQLKLYPTLRWFRNGVAQVPDYNGSRSIQGLAYFAKSQLESDEKFKDWNTKAFPQAPQVTETSVILNVDDAKEEIKNTADSIHSSADSLADADSLDMEEDEKLEESDDESNVNSEMTVAMPHAKEEH